MEFIKTPIEGLIITHPKRFEDKRGYFSETFRKDLFAKEIGDVDFVQDNESESVYGTLRGLHLQFGSKSQAKLVRVVEGAVYDVAVDLRKGSATFGKWFAIELSHENGLNLFIPRGFAHGFAVLTPKARFIYKADNYYAPESEVTIAFNDAQIGVEWPALDVPYILSDRDLTKAVSLDDFRKMLDSREL